MQAVMQHFTLAAIGGKGKMWVRVLGQGPQTPFQLPHVEFAAG